MAELILARESYELIGLCMECIENYPGFSEAIYKEALEIELKTSHMKGKNCIE